MTEAQRDEIEAVLVDLRAEELDQQTDRGHASNRLVRAIILLEQLLEASSEPSASGQPDRARHDSRP